MNISFDQKILWKFFDLGKLAPLIRERNKYEIRDTSHSNNQRTKTQDDQPYQIHAIRLDRVVHRYDSVVYRLAAYSNACCCNPSPQTKLLKAAASCKEMP